MSHNHVTGNSASALRRIAKRREAFATANPYLVTTIGLGDAYIYCKGVLCYILKDKLRVLNLHGSGCHEAVVSIPGLLSFAISEAACNARGIFQLLYYSDSIISCLYKTSGPEANSWLIAFSIETREILVVRELISTEKIFVRNDGKYLYYGTHSEVSINSRSMQQKRWVVCGYDFTQEKWFDQKIQFLDLIGSEVGFNICFEFHDGYFYALSSQTTFEVEEIDWTSFYHGTRFPLDSPCKELIEKTENESMWRRQHLEGPIDDRWTNLKLEMDESTGDLRIIETRKEWYRGGSRSQRTYYTTPLIFPQRSNGTDGNIHHLADGTSSHATTASSSSVQADPNSLMATQSSTSGDHNNRNLSHYPNDPILRLLHKDDNPNYMPPRTRHPQFTHPGHDGSSNLNFTLAKSRIRYYHSSSSTFLDVVDDPIDWQGRQRLRLRAGSRKLGPPHVYPADHPSKAGLLCSPPSDVWDALNQMYRQSDVTYWPPAQDPEVANKDLDQLYKVLNPPTHLGNVEGTADERSLVYVTGGYDGPQAIIFVSFDPTIKLEGVKRWGGMARKGMGEGPHIDGRANRHTSDVNDQMVTSLEYAYKGENRHGQKMDTDILEADRVIGIDRKGKGKAKENCANTTAPPEVEVGGQAYVNMHGTSSATASSSKSSNPSWIWHEKAMYQEIGRGFYFGMDRKTIDTGNGGKKGKEAPVFTS